MNRSERTFCTTFQRAIELIGRRWTGAIIQVLEKGPIRFAGVLASVTDITPRMLTERLRELEEAGIVQRTVLPERPPRVEYALTEMGYELGKVLQGVGAWAQRWLPPEKAARASDSRSRRDGALRSRRPGSPRHAKVSR
ncbi:MAG: winged helix-turn-helix transcriptional regulator [Gemmatimonadaceae bacterium]